MSREYDYTPRDRWGDDTSSIDRYYEPPASYSNADATDEEGLISGITVANGARRAWILDGHIYIDGEELSNYSPSLPDSAQVAGLIRAVRRDSNVDYDYIDDGELVLGTLNNATPLAQYNNPDASDVDGLLRGVECHSDVDQPYVRDGILMLNGMPVRFDPQWFVVQDRRVTLNLSSLQDAIALGQTYIPGWDW